jgi:hypothetical protein
MNPYPKNILLHFLAFLWMRPNHLIGLLFFLLLKLTRQKPILNYDICLDVVVPENSTVAQYFRNKGWAAVTLGDFIFYWGLDQYAYIETQFHERRHVQQQTYLGPLFYPVYFLLLLYGYAKYQSFKLLKLTTQKPILLAYLHHPLEKDARKYSDEQSIIWNRILGENN